MTAIAWTDETWNPTVGCSKVSPGCDHLSDDEVVSRLCRRLVDSTTARWLVDRRDQSVEAETIDDILTGRRR